MSTPRSSAAAPSPLLLLLPVALAEVAINRVAVPMLRPLRGDPPLWHTALDYIGLFLFYFASLLAVVACGLRVLRAIDQRGGARVREALGSAPLVVLGLCSVWAVLVSASKGLTLAMDVALAGVVIAAIARGFGHFFGARRDLGAVFAVVFLSLPILVHTAAAVGARWFWGDAAYDDAPVMARYGAMALTVAGLVSPYCLAPRPFVRAVTRLTPVAVAILTALAAAWLLRGDYFATARALKLAVGFELETGRADPQLTVYLLATATLAWTVTSCALALRPERRAVAAALAFLVAGGTAYQWPLHYLLLALGLTAIADAAVPLRAAEATSTEGLRGAGPASAPVDDATWGRYLASVTSALRRRFTSLHSLTTRAPEGSTSTVLIGEAEGCTVRTRIDRDGGAVIGVDIALGRDLEAVPTTASLTVVSDDPVLLADAPAAEDELPRDGDEFSRRFRCHGSAAALAQLFDAPLRERAAALLDGWLAYVEGRSLRYRTYPGRRGAVEHFLPLADLAQGRVPPGAGERALVIFELLLELAARGQLTQLPSDGGDAAAPPDGGDGAEPDDGAAPVEGAERTATASASGDEPATATSPASDAPLAPGDSA